MKKSIMRALALFLAVTMMAAMMPATAITVSAAEEPITRAEWIRELVVLFDMTLEDDGDMPDVSFADFNILHDLFHCVMTAIQFGIIDLETDTEIIEGEFYFNPDGAATRSFAARSMNFCLGFVPQEDETYYFGNFSYQTAVNRSWFELIDGQFMPDNYITEDEKNIMLADAAVVWTRTIVDPCHENTFTFADGVIVVPDGTDVSRDEYDVITIINSPVEISEGQIFIIFSFGLPISFTAESVYISNGVKTIETTPREIGEDIIEADAQGIIEICLSAFVPYYDTFIIDDFQYGTHMSPQGVLRNRTFTTPRFPGVSINLSNLRVTYGVAVNWDGARAFIGLSGDINISGSSSIYIDSEFILGSVKTPLGSISVYLVVNAGGGFTITYTTGFNTVAEYVLGEGLSVRNRFTPRGFRIDANVGVSVAAKLSWGVEAIVFNLSFLYVKTGIRFNINTTFWPDPPPAVA